VTCGVLLRLVDTPDTTSDLPDNVTETVSANRRWGTARFDLDNLLVLTLRDYDVEPIRVDLATEKTIGRTHKNYTPDIDLGPYDAYDRGVSRKHAILRRQSDTIVIIDLNSANSTYLNGQRLVPEQPRIIRDGDEIRLGQLVIRVSFEDVS
jgi:hypothetical protein